MACDGTPARLTAAAAPPAPAVAALRFDASAEGALAAAMGSGESLERSIVAAAAAAEALGFLTPLPLATAGGAALLLLPSPWEERERKCVFYTIYKSCEHKSDMCTPCDREAWSGWPAAQRTRDCTWRAVLRRAWGMTSAISATPCSAHNFAVLLHLQAVSIGLSGGLGQPAFRGQGEQDDALHTQVGNSNPSPKKEKITASPKIATPEHLLTIASRSLCAEGWSPRWAATQQKVGVPATSRFGGVTLWPGFTTTSRSINPTASSCVT